MFRVCSVLLCILRLQFKKTKPHIWTDLLPFCYCHFQSSCALCGQNSRRSSTVHGRNSRHFLRGIFSPALYSAARIPGETVQYMDGTLAILSWHFQSCSVLCGQNSRKNSRIHGRNSRHFFSGMFSPAVYSAAGILGRTVQYSTWTELSPFFSWHFQSCSVLCGQNSRKTAGYMDGTLAIFVSGMFSPAVYSAAGILGKTVEYMDGTLAIFFLACSVLLCTLRPEF